MRNRKVKLYLAMSCIVGALSLSGCGAEEVQTEISTNQEIQAETKQTEKPEETAEMVPEETAEMIPEETKVNQEVQESVEEFKEVENAEVEEPAEVEAIKQEDVQMIQPIQVSYMDASGNNRNSYYDADGECTMDVNGTTYEYVTDVQGGKVYGCNIIENLGGIGSCRWVGNRPLVNVSDYSDALVLTSESSYEVAKYLYDEENRLIKISYSDGVVTSIEYKDLGNGAMIVTWSQTLGGNRGEIEIGIGGYVSRMYWEFNNGELGEETYITYDDNKQVSIIKKVETGGSTTYSYTYDAEGNILTENIELPSKIERTEYEGYDEDGNYSIKKIYVDDALQAAFFYEHDEFGNLTKESLVMGLDERTLEFQYDEKGRPNNISADGLILYQFNFGENGALESVECVNEYVRAEFESNHTIEQYWGSPLASELRSEVQNMIQKYTGIDAINATYIDFIYG